MAPSFSRVSSGALLLALAYNAQPVKADFWEDVDNCELVLNDLPSDITTDFCHDWTYGHEPEDEYVTVTGYPTTVTEYPDAKTCDDEGYKTTTKEGYPASTPYPSYEASKGYPTSTPYPSYEASKGYEPSKPTSKGSKTTKVPDESTKVPDESTKVPDESTKVPDESTEVPDQSTKVPGETTKAPEQPPPTDVPEGGYDVTVTSTIYTTYFTTSTVYDESYPTPAPYRRHARQLNTRQLGDRASWCVDRPCRLVQYDDDTIVEACKKYLGLAPETKTVDVPGYTVTVTSYPTDCKKKDDGYKPDPVPAYPTEKDDDYEAKPYPTETPEYDSYPTETPEYDPYPTEEPTPYPEEDYNDDNYDDGNYDNGSYEDDSYDDGNYDDGSDEKQPWDSDFDNNYSGPDGPKPWDDADQTSELADAIEAGGYDNAENELGLDDAPWNAIPEDFPDNYGGDYKRRSAEYKTDDSYGEEDGVDCDEEPTYDSYPTEEPPAYPEDSYKPDEDSYEPEAPEEGYPTEGPSDDYPVDNSYDDSYDDSYDSYAPEPEWTLPDGDDDQYEGDEFEANPYPETDGPPDYYSTDSWAGDGVDY